MVLGNVESAQVALGLVTLKSAQILGHLESARGTGEFFTGGSGICTGVSGTSGICTDSGTCGICTGAIGSSGHLDTRLMTRVMRTLDRLLEKGRDFSSKGRFSTGT
ncbi:hypothetical protein TNCV_2368391 [Trichonephila clavipes]|nr:hypothetical protein TNCV_2368391 [Trichonephila clavipes]